MLKSEISDKMVRQNIAFLNGHKPTLNKNTNIKIVSYTK